MTQKRKLTEAEMEANQKHMKQMIREKHRGWCLGMADKIDSGDI